MIASRSRISQHVLLYYFTYSWYSCVLSHPLIPPRPQSGARDQCGRFALLFTTWGLALSGGAGGTGRSPHRLVVICARSVRRSIRALHNHGLGMICGHSENGRLVVTMTAVLLARSAIPWNISSEAVVVEIARQRHHAAMARMPSCRPCRAAITPIFRRSRPAPVAARAPLLKRLRAGGCTGLVTKHVKISVRNQGSAGGSNARDAPPNVFVPEIDVREMDAPLHPDARLDGRAPGYGQINRRLRDVRWAKIRQHSGPEFSSKATRALACAWTLLHTGH